MEPSTGIDFYTTALRILPTYQLTNTMTPKEIRDLRRSLGMTQVTFAPELGFARAQTVSELERGTKKPTKQTLIILSYLRARAEKLAASK